MPAAAARARHAEIGAEKPDTVRVVFAVAEFLFEAQWAPFVAGAGTDVEAVIELPRAVNEAEPAGFACISEAGPATLNTKIIRAWTAWHDKQLRLRDGPRRRQGDGSTDA